MSSQPGHGSPRSTWGTAKISLMRKGARKAKVPLTPATRAALDAYLAARAHRAGLDGPARLAGPLLATATGGRLRQGHLWELVRPARPRRGHRHLAGIVAAFAAALGDHLCPRRLRGPARCAGLRRAQGPPALRGATTTPGTAWTATPPTWSRRTSRRRSAVAQRRRILLSGLSVDDVAPLAAALGAGPLGSHAVQRAEPAGPVRAAVGHS